MVEGKTRLCLRHFVEGSVASRADPETVSAKFPVRLRLLSFTILNASELLVCR